MKVVSVAWAVLGVLAVLFVSAHLLRLLGVVNPAPGPGGAEAPGTTSQPAGAVGVVELVSGHLGVALFGLVAAAFCFAVALARPTQPNGGRGPATDRFAKRWLWRPASLAFGLFLLFAWADSLDEWRSPARPRGGWEEWWALARVFVFGAGAWHLILSAVFTGWRASAEPGPAPDTGRVSASGSS